MKSTLILLFLSFSVSFSQQVINIPTFFVQNGNLYEGLGAHDQRFTEFKKGHKCIVIDYLGRNHYKVQYKKWIGYVMSEDLSINNELKEFVRVYEENEKKRKEQEKIKRELEIQTQIKKREDERLERKKKEDSVTRVREVERKEHERIEKVEYRNNCHYRINEFDEFDKIKVIKTKEYWVSNDLSIELYKRGNKEYVFFNLMAEIGCASSYSNDKSYVKIKLENNEIVTFYHSWDIDCDSFHLKANLTNLEIMKLKKSSIKSIRLQGTDYYYDIQHIEYKEFFSDKLKCLN